MTEISPTTTAYQPPVDTLHDTPTRVTVDVPSRIVFKVLLLVALFGLGIHVVQQLTGLFVQIAIAAFLAVAADPVVRRMERRGIGRGRAVAVVMLAAVAAIALFVSVFVPPLVEQGDRLASSAPSIVHDVQHSHLFRDLDRRYDVVARAGDQAAKLPGKVSNQIGSIVGAVAAGLLGTITVLFLTVFLLLGGGQVVEGTVRVFPKIAERRWWSIVQGAYTGIAAYVGGAIVIALIGGSVMTISAFALGLPYALPLGLWMMLLEIIPLIGATIGAVPGIVVAFVAGGVVDGIVLTCIVIAYQQVENIVIQPRVQGRAAALSPLVVFVAVLVGSQLLGVLGALFAVPVAGVLQIFVRQLIVDQGSEELTVPALAPDDAPTAPDVDDDGLPGRTGADGSQL
ncbi:MAG: family transporter [Thermoleophilia bacterium]|nr:family transporter [Thermoleophilia bacterium]